MRVSAYYHQVENIALPASSSASAAFACVRPPAAIGGFVEGSLPSAMAAAGAAPSLEALAAGVLPFRTASYVTQLVQKLLNEGIVEPSDLTVCSKYVLETKLAKHESFCIGEIADVLHVRNKISEGTCESKRESRREGKRQRSRSERRRRRPERSTPPKSALWCAVERGNQEEVFELLKAGHDPDDMFQGWTVLMKAAEDDHVDIINMLIDRGADLEIANRKGRTALSFAAAPSMGRKTPLAALRLLLSRGADLRAEDDGGMVPKERAQREKRLDAVQVIEMFEKQAVTMDTSA